MSYMTVYINDDAIEPRLTAHIEAVSPALSPSTIKARRQTVLRVASFLGQPVATADTPDIEAWRHDVTAPGRKPKPLVKSSLATALAHLSSYYTWLIKQGDRADNPIDRLDRPRHPYEKLPRPIAETHFGRALRHAGQPMRVWLQLGAHCGLRCMEIAGISREDIDTGTTPRVRVLGKGDKERTVRLPSGLYAELCGGDFPESGPLWLHPATGQPYTPAQVSRTINTYLRKLGIPSTAHGLRHLFGTELFRRTRNLVKVQHAMGHTEIGTTLGYVKVVGDDETDEAIEAMGCRFDESA